MKKIIIIVLMLLMIFTLCSCDTIRENIKEEALENLIGKIMGEEVDITIKSTADAVVSDTTPEPTYGILDGLIEDGSEKDIEWPEDIPAIVPQTGLKITKKIKTPNGVILDFDSAVLSDVKNYTDILKQYSYETVREDISDKKFDAYYTKDKTSISVYWYSEGGFSLMITWD